MIEFYDFDFVYGGVGFNGIKPLRRIQPSNSLAVRKTSS